MKNVTALGIKSQQLRCKADPVGGLRFTQIGHVHLRGVDGVLGVCAIGRVQSDMVHKGIGGKAKSNGVIAVIHMAIVVDPVGMNDILMQFKQSAGKFVLICIHLRFILSVANLPAGST